MSLTLILIIITAGLSIFGFNNPAFTDKMLNNPYAVVRGKQYYRLLTSGFVHADFTHLFFNMFVLYSFGNNMESILSSSFGESGGLYFLGLYILGIIFSSIPDLIKHKDAPYYNSLGASGGVASVLFAFIILLPTSTLMIFPIPIDIPAWIFSIMYVAYSIYMDKRNADNVNHLAHLWGALWGVLFVSFLFPGSLAHFFRQILGVVGF